MIANLHLWLDELDPPPAHEPGHQIDIRWDHPPNGYPSQVLERPVAHESAWSRILRRRRSGRPTRDPAGILLRIPLLDPEERARDSHR